MGIQTLKHGLLRMGGALVLGAALFAAAQGQAADGARIPAQGKPVAMSTQAAQSNDLAVLIFLHENAGIR
jgi:hypothetical protein